MVPKERAKELIDKFKSLVIFTLSDGTISEYIRNRCAQQCALIAVEEIIKVLTDDGVGFSKYWEEVKEEIQRL